MRHLSKENFAAAGGKRLFAQSRPKKPSWRSQIYSSKVVPIILSLHNFSKCLGCLVWDGKICRPGSHENAHFR